MKFLQLLRPVNLVIIALTMYSVRFFYFTLGSVSTLTIANPFRERIDFFLLVFSTVLIAAGGNIINDYFDVRADRINRPEKLIITKYVKRRWAIITHWLFNLVAFSIAIYLSARYQTFWYVFIHLLTINSLWFYSMYFKRKPFIGNFIIAGLTALVPILCGIHFHLQTGFPDSGNGTVVLPDVYTIYDSIAIWKIRLLANGRFVFLLAYFAFTLNLSREIIKDMEDIEGDKLLYAKTLPIALGIQKSSWIATTILALAPVFFILLFLLHVQQDFLLHLLALLPLALSAALNIISAFILMTNPADIRKLKRADFVLKISMLLGILVPFYWWFFRV
jgi:4-hydroxybenzoate polyprenyltransferase